MRKQSERHFDPQVLDAFLTAWRDTEPRARLAGAVGS